MKFEYTGIRVRDMDRSIEFYTRIMGMKLLNRSRIPSTKGEVAALQSPGSQQVLELNYYEGGSEYNTPYDPGEGLDHLGFRVGNLRKVLDDLMTRGVEVAIHPLSMKGDDGSNAIVAFVKDPDGIWIELYQGSS